jgi:hypothetical protein
MAVLIDVEEDGNIELWSAVGGESTKVAAEGKPVQSL